MPPRPSTFSIVARDPKQDAIGVAVQSKFVSVGSVVPFASADAGAIATQSFANVAYGPDGLDLLREGKSASEVIEALTDGDDQSAERQVGIVGRDGSVAAFTGADCFEFAGDIQGENYTVQGNILENRATIEAMADTYESTAGGLPERLIAALQAGNEAGGDVRGEQSAALYVVKPEGGYDGGNDRWIDVRVDDHESPIDELERVFRVYDVTLLEREPPDTFRELDGATAEAVTEALVEAGFSEGASNEFDKDERAALADFRDANNFENHDLDTLEDALARGWDDAGGSGETRLVNAIWHGIAGRERA
ncbi:DUF1028 domain-containing protein [Halococcus dombrowskii]|uniref:DUF1028 domain-containing protein n=1 Tax=Halococcus dombrowskii TaxID=179637 RepID=A0AAV3SFE3_HALDO|nr:DUF1028 domain-containing protein [Halococcus dombrowskii]UOO94540.1 DUF1028 domain-containing protein [Halococcus dombrowskii]